MTYTKPTIDNTSGALEAILGSTNKPPFAMQLDHNNQTWNASATAYEADE